MSLASTYRTAQKKIRKMRAARFLKRHRVKFAAAPEISGKMTVVSRGSISLGDDIVISSSMKANPVDGYATCIFCRKGASVSIASGCRISNARICARDSITIGKNVYIGAGCRIYDSDFHPLDYEKRIANDQDEIASSPVVIGNGAFLGAGAMILKGVRIGEKAIVGAGAVVTKDIPDGAVAAGNPARIIKEAEDK